MAENKRYQVFVSSTFADLEEERSQVIRTLLEMDCIPAGMELFPAVDEEQFEFIKRVIDDSDYYLVIVGGRYGSVTPDGVSYTEKEYDYACEIGLKSVVLLHADPTQITVAKSDTDREAAKRLSVFREKLATNRLVKHWRTSQDLPGLVALSLTRTIKVFPAVGWVRAVAVGSRELLAEVNELRKENLTLQKRVVEMERDRSYLIGGLAELDDVFELSYYNHSYGTTRRVPTTWREIFGAVSPLLQKHPLDRLVKAHLMDWLRKKNMDRGSRTEFDEEVFNTIRLQLQALGLIKITEKQTATNLGAALYWSLTERGTRLMLQLRTVKSSNTTPLSHDSQ